MSVPTPAEPDAEPTEEVFRSLRQFPGSRLIYPNSKFLTSVDARRGGQRYYLFGTTASFAELVEWYRTELRLRGELVFDNPATHQFDIGRFAEETMAFPPGVTIKNFQSELSAGFPNPRRGEQPARFPTIVQIVPAPGR